MRNESFNRTSLPFTWLLVFFVSFASSPKHLQAAPCWNLTTQKTPLNVSEILLNFPKNAREALSPDDIDRLIHAWTLTIQTLEKTKAQSVEVHALLPKVARIFQDAGPLFWGSLPPKHSPGELLLKPIQLLASLRMQLVQKRLSENRAMNRPDLQAIDVVINFLVQRFPKSNLSFYFQSSESQNFALAILESILESQKPPMPNGSMDFMEQLFLAVLNLNVDQTKPALSPRGQRLVARIFLREPLQTKLKALNDWESEPPSANKLTLWEKILLFGSEGLIESARSLHKWQIQYGANPVPVKDFLIHPREASGGTAAGSHIDQSIQGNPKVHLGEKTSSLEYLFLNPNASERFILEHASIMGMNLYIDTTSMAPVYLVAALLQNLVRETILFNYLESVMKMKSLNFKIGGNSRTPTDIAKRELSDSDRQKLILIKELFENFAIGRTYMGAKPQGFYLSQLNQMVDPQLLLSPLVADIVKRLSQLRFTGWNRIQHFGFSEMRVQTLDDLFHILIRQPVVGAFNRSESPESMAATLYDIRNAFKMNF